MSFLFVDAVYLPVYFGIAWLAQGEILPRYSAVILRGIDKPPVWHGHVLLDLSYIDNVIDTRGIMGNTDIHP